MSSNREGAEKNHSVAKATLWFFGAPVEIRTPDPLIKSQVLYRLSYRGDCASKQRLIIVSYYFLFVKHFCKKSLKFHQKNTQTRLDNKNRVPKHPI